MCVFTQHPIETLVPSTVRLKKKCDVFTVSCRQIYIHFIGEIKTSIVYDKINLLLP